MTPVVPTCSSVVPHVGSRPSHAPAARDTAEKHPFSNYWQSLKQISLITLLINFHGVLACLYLNVQSYLLLWFYIKVNDLWDFHVTSYAGPRIFWIMGKIVQYHCCRAANPSANPSGTLQNFFRDIHKSSGTFFHDNFMGQILILHFENMLPPFAKLHLVSARATAGACELLQRFVALFGFNWRSFSWRKLRCVDQVWMKFYILNMSLRADTDKKMRCVCEICIHEYISTKLVISVIFEVSSVLRNFSTLPVSCPGNSGTVGSSVAVDALAPTFARSVSAMILTVRFGNVPVFFER